MDIQMIDIQFFLYFFFLWVMNNIYVKIDIIKTSIIWFSTVDIFASIQKHISWHISRIPLLSCWGFIMACMETVLIRIIQKLGLYLGQDIEKVYLYSIHTHIRATQSISIAIRDLATDRNILSEIFAQRETRPIQPTTTTKQ